MKGKNQAKEPEAVLDVVLKQRLVWNHVLLNLLTVIAFILPLVVSFLTLTKVKSIRSSFEPNVILRSVLFLAAISLLGVIIGAFAAFIKRTNREVILLKHRLAKIYLSALRES